MPTSPPRDPPLDPTALVADLLAGDQHSRPGTPGLPPVVLVVTDRFDVTADHVVMELDGRGLPVFRFDTGEFPRRPSVSARLDADHCGSLRTPS